MSATNAVTSTGITTKDQATLLAEQTADLEAIYGADIDLSPESPDGQELNIRVTATIDQEELITEVYTSMDPDQAFGKTLDSRVAINGIQRQAGTFTVTNISITTTQSLTLQGLDLYPSAPYTVQDGQGNQFQLQITQNPAGPGVYIYAFQSAVPGAVRTSPNTITIPTTVVLGVSNINNPTTWTSLGLDEEKDAALKVRRQKAVSLVSQGFTNSLQAALENVAGVTSSYIHENDGDAVDAAGVPGHTIWVVIDGSATAADIAAVIYRKRGTGAGTYGSVIVSVMQLDGTLFPIKFDYVTLQTLYANFTLTSLDGKNLPNTTAILAKLPALFSPVVNQEVNINNLATLIQQIDPNALATFASGGVEGFSATGVAGSYTALLSPSTANQKFTLLSANISITVTPL